MKVKELMKDKKAENQPVKGTSLVKDLLSKTVGKGGKIKAIKVKVKFGGKSEKDNKKSVSHDPAGHKDV